VTHLEAEVRELRAWRTKKEKELTELHEMVDTGNAYEAMVEALTAKNLELEEKVIIIVIVIIIIIITPLIDTMMSCTRWWARATPMRPWSRRSRPRTSSSRRRRSTMMRLMMMLIVKTIVNKRDP
jgi:hypothetical protein